MDALQLAPNHADHISLYRAEYLEQMFREEAVIAQPKYDGERMLIHIVGNDVVCTSRRFSKKTDRYMENQDRVQMLKEFVRDNLDCNYTVLDCECYAKTWSEAASVLHSKPERAAELCKTIDIKFAVFDCLYFNGKDIRDQAYANRVLFAKKVIDSLFVDFKKIHLVKFMNKDMRPCDISECDLLKNASDAKLAMDNAIAAGFEGCVVKSLARKYYDKAASLKCKKFETVDVVVCDYQQGTGKYSNTVGALMVGYYDPATDSVVRISKVNCGTDADRDMWRDRWNELKGSVIEVKCQEVTSKSLRHPVYLRLREDKNSKECTRETIFKEDCDE